MQNGTQHIARRNFFVPPVNEYRDLINFLYQVPGTGNRIIPGTFQVPVPGTEPQVPTGGPNRG